jgi:hypothetical protein
MERDFHFCPQCAAKIPLRDRAEAGPSETPARKSDTKAAIIVGSIFGALGLVALGFGILALAIVVFLRLGTSLAIAGWATSARRWNFSTRCLAPTASCPDTGA